MKKELQTSFDENTDRIDLNKILEENASSFPSGFKAGDITSVSINTTLDFIAVALQHEDYDKNLALALLDYEGNFLSSYETGVQWDMVTCSGNDILTADEGEPRLGYINGVDPKGSVTLIDVTGGLTSGNSSILDFSSHNSQRDSCPSGSPAEEEYQSGCRSRTGKYHCLRRQSLCLSLPRSIRRNVTTLPLWNS